MTVNRQTTACRPDRGTGPQDLLRVQDALRGDREAVDSVLHRLSCVVRFVYRLNRSMGYHLPTEGLEDVVQQVYLAVWPRLADYSGTSALETWVYGFCRNCLRAEFRHRASRSRTTHSLANWDEQAAGDLRVGAGSVQEQHTLRMESLDLLHEELARLEDFDREIVELRHLREWSFERIARQKSLPPSTIKDRCYRALNKIRVRLKRYDRA